MKIASWNVNSLNVRMPHLVRWLEDARPDVVGLQEFEDVQARSFAARTGSAWAMAARARSL